LHIFLAFKIIKKKSIDSFSQFGVGVHMINSKKEFNSSFGWKENLDGLSKPHFMIIGVTFALEEALKVYKTNQEKYKKTIIFLTKSNYLDLNKQLNDEKYQDLLESLNNCIEKLKPTEISLETLNIQTLFRNKVARKLADESLKRKSSNKITYNNIIKKRKKNDTNPQVLRIFCEGAIFKNETLIGIGIHIPNIDNKFDLSRGLKATEIKTNYNEIQVVAAIFGLRQALKVIEEYKNTYKIIMVYTDSQILISILSREKNQVKPKSKIIHAQLYSNILDLIKQFEPLEIKWVNRNKSKVNKNCIDKAHVLAFQAITDLTKC
jgi:ribonuclease HI